MKTKLDWVDVILGKALNEAVLFPASPRYYSGPVPQIPQWSITITLWWWSPQQRLQSLGFMQSLRYGGFIPYQPKWLYVNITQCQIQSCYHHAAIFGYQSQRLNPPKVKFRTHASYIHICRVFLKWDIFCCNSKHILLQLFDTQTENVVGKHNFWEI